ncbi:hypothetical protein PbB2_01520 [Candidatus Phycosocius bacilliformis]|uniref:Uncharacterized protein n=1 Tax=Candidatus Phycosocius bacilliformis TaxID=1445552 RepID=A0A2P2E9V2_9PROT|nr:hypothetical protein [Candidatus Phycosocius bacilliformis]GBF57850.1 hypothetical protein PbB2_01520 [Candidatus Phycosocius bacilliformis]
MAFSLAPFAFVLSLALRLHSHVLAKDNLWERPHFVRKAVAARLRAGVRALEAFLRRILILMALDLEHELIAKPQVENLRRKKARKPSVRTPGFRVFPAPFLPHPDTLAQRFEALSAAVTGQARPFNFAPAPVPIGHWLRRLDLLQAIAADPEAKAKRLAYSLARRRPGPMLAPEERPRIMARRGHEISATFDAMGFQITQKSRSRPPPLPPPRRWPVPMITLL